MMMMMLLLLPPMNAQRRFSRADRKIGVAWWEGGEWKGEGCVEDVLFVERSADKDGRCLILLE